MAMAAMGSIIVPRFRPLNRILMDRKVIYVVANIRGGGEYGESWHLEGNLTNKQNVFDDFAACVSFMTDAGYTTPQRTAILGGSNGGLLMGATLTQHPGQSQSGRCDGRDLRHACESNFHPTVLST